MLSSSIKVSNNTKETIFMKYFFLLTTTITTLVLVGCANRAVVSPSQNSSLDAVSPSSTTLSKGGVMQHSLDQWLIDEWSPITKTVPVKNTTTATHETSFTETKKVEDVSVADDNESFTLQKYVDKWEVYNKNKSKVNEGKPKEPSHVEMMKSLPVVGK
jgi:hypothetical protein